MKKSLTAMVIATEAVIAVGLAATAHASLYPPLPPPPFPGSAPSGDSAQDVVSRLQSSGYKVMLTRIGNLSLDQCAVTSVTPGQQITTPVTAGADGTVFKVLYTTVYVTADCTHPKAGN
jgi:hypothetical protein